ncbi:MerR family transcriptional regulator [Schaalia vaccimaxillae]|uniref:MerR family transcriptional regulator n=1 Tax=Schaalia vaccimaxillae TaxID=183916 RepID=UPI0003B664DA|nr:MerR family transcriptional regulator [Schaalia vaccimaxillae]
MVSSTDEGLTVGAVANLVGVSIRTLHHWDAIGLVHASGRTWSGYRLYTSEDVGRVHQVLVYRETGMTLSQIRTVLDDPDVDSIDHLLSQRNLLTQRISHLHRMVRAVDRMLTEHQEGRSISMEEQAEIYGSQWMAYEAEAEEKWGHTDDWSKAQSHLSQQSFQEKQEDLERIREVELQLAAAMAEGEEAGSARANELAEKHRRSMNWFEVTPAKHVLLGRMYVADPRFTAHYEDLRPGLAAWLKDVIDANARAHGVDPERAQWQ